ncbi:hypothetical protein KBTX_00984 [wastewater metagenome]|uniref:Chalcone isomerase domain-containing protein n=2 Tax=unclassified sequences TaxID=12908 RepID=A0A5B8R7J8_9ZZZZ|nr:MULTISPECIES: chalcone isomerase family protein [Arhodomonas]MCS4503727.1 chalcone isomerase family protein [Arhodomonas aquaeolei]QEA04676.1 hypothetical protein KBTEX_00984 [uncultured organism]
MLTTTIRGCRAAALVLAGVLLAGPATAAELAGVHMPERMEVDGESLSLNGLGLREKFFFDIYVGGLYLPETTGRADDVLSLDGPRRVVLHLVYDHVSREKLVEAWNDGFEDNLSEDRRKALAERIEAFNELFGDAEAGDEIAIDYLPGQGTRVVYNGKVTGTVPGRALARAWLAIFVGAHPADEDVKSGMLGG